MFMAASAAPPVRPYQGALGIVQHRPVDGARQAVFGKFAFAARIDDGIELAQQPAARLRHEVDGDQPLECHRRGQFSSATRRRRAVRSR
jgi:hypothetical protein